MDDYEIAGLTTLESANTREQIESIVNSRYALYTEESGVSSAGLVKVELLDDGNESRLAIVLVNKDVKRISIVPLSEESLEAIFGMMNIIYRRNTNNG